MKVGARQVATSSILLFVENLLRLAAVAGISFWIARYLGPSQFGILNFASALIAIFLSISTMGLDTPVILRLTQSEKSGEILGTVLAIRAVAGLVALTIAVVIIFVLKHTETTVLLVALIISLSIVAYIPTTFDYWFKSRTSALLPATSRTTGTLLSVAAKVVCIMLGLGVVALAWTVVLEAALISIGLVVSYLYVTKAHLRDSLSFNLQLGKALLKQSWPYLLSTVTLIAYMKIDVVMLGYLSSNEETGIYSLAQKLSEVLYMLPVVLVDSAYPALAKRFLSSEKNNQHGQMLFDFAVGISLIATVCALLLAKPVIHTLFGLGYERSISIFYLHAWSCVAIAMNTARHQWLATIGLQRYAPVVTVIGLVVNVLMNFALIPSLGAMGAAITTVASYFISGYVTSFIFSDLREIGWMQTRALWPWSRLNIKARIWITK